jgi:hypothetical protein
MSSTKKPPIGGRKPYKVRPERIREIWRQRKDEPGFTKTKLARELSISVRTVRLAINGPFDRELGKSEAQRGSDPVNAIDVGPVDHNDQVEEDEMPSEKYRGLRVAWT